MAGTAATDPTAQIIPGAAPFSEWTVRIHGFIATCVESVETAMLAIYKLAPATPATDRSLAQDLINRGQAGSGGATNWYAASQQLGRMGVPNTPYGPSEFTGNQWQDVLNQALGQGKPVLFGLSNAQALRDDFTGQRFDLGVQGHAIEIVGRDASGYIAVDPNQNPATQALVHYTAANLQAAGASSMDVPTMSTPQGSGNGIGGVFQQVTFPTNGGPIDPTTGASSMTWQDIVNQSLQQEQQAAQQAQYSIFGTTQPVSLGQAASTAFINALGLGLNAVGIPTPAELATRGILLVAAGIIVLLGIVLIAHS